MTQINMTAFGLSERFAVLTTDYPNLLVGRILSQERGLYRVISVRGEQFAETSGKFHYEVGRVSDFPAVGDFVMIDCPKSMGNAIIHHILPRKSVFIRKAVGTAQKEQVIAANIDTVFICMSLNNDFNLRRLERYLSICWESGTAPVVVLTKADLCKNTAEKLSSVEGVAMGADILITSAIEQDGYEQVLPYIKEGHTIALIGSSGVGKSTLINRLLGEKRLNTTGLRKDDKGRHTTTRRELFLLPNGGLVIDTPGMRELGLWNAAQGLDKTFSDIDELSAKCRFKNCSHTTEPGCGIIAAIEGGDLTSERWQSYQKLKAENAYAEDAESYLAAKEQKHKNLAKIIKQKKSKGIIRR
ncbi:ribosome small subunit-dependent GTPase A [Brevibacillus nitrificans]|nr:ribosome small subunit-dependent GTPase A [Brevibacillus nitrificans]MED1793628.1 ribosome small subunit-dependent GTPase A [Brevibacillus nitrificans]